MAKTQVVRGVSELKNWPVQEDLHWWKPAFPDPTFVHQAADFVPSLPAYAEAGPAFELEEGPRFYVSVSPGKVKIFTRDEADRDRSLNGQLDDMARTDAMASWLIEGEEVPEATVRGTISEWSRKSQNRMREMLCDLDYTTWADPTRPLATMTLTYPRCWLTVAPDSAATTKHSEALRKRFKRAFGIDLLAIWKREFQDRPPWQRCTCETCDGRDDGRAPHFHILFQRPERFALTRYVPVVDVDGRPVLNEKGRPITRKEVLPEAGEPVNFNQWLSETWADVVDHPDPEQRELHRRAGTNVKLDEEVLNMTDPRRLADYFLKHSGGAFGDKAYQHRVPEAWDQRPGRFWGVWGLRKVIATRRVDKQVGEDAGRIVRRYSRSLGVTQRVRKMRGKLGAVAVSKYPEVIGLAGKELLAARGLVSGGGGLLGGDDARVLEKPRKAKTRFTRRRAIRCRNGRGWISLNSAPDFAVQLGLALMAGIEDRFTQANRHELERAGRWSTPSARAARLTPGPRRDALLAKLRARENRGDVVLDESMFDHRERTAARRPRPSTATCSVCGGRLAPELAHLGHHLVIDGGSCAEDVELPLAPSPRSRPVAFTVLTEDNPS